MIDTIKFFIPITDMIIREKFAGCLMRFKKDDMKTGKVEFEFYTAQIKLGSHSRTVSVKMSENPLGLFVEFSVPKYKRGNNVEMIYPHDLPNIMTEMYLELCQYLDYYQLPQGKGILEQLIIPSESSKFDLIGQQGILPL